MIRTCENNRRWMLSRVPTQCFASMRCFHAIKNSIGFMCHPIRLRVQRWSEQTDQELSTTIRQETSNSRHHLDLIKVSPSTSRYYIPVILEKEFKGLLIRLPPCWETPVPRTVERLMVVQIAKGLTITNEVIFDYSQPSVLI